MCFYCKYLLFRSLYEVSRNLGELVMPKGHFDANGNSTIADDVVAALMKKSKK